MRGVTFLLHTGDTDTDVKTVMTLLSTLTAYSLNITNDPEISDVLIIAPDHFYKFKDYIDKPIILLTSETGPFLPRLNIIDTTPYIRSDDDILRLEMRMLAAANDIRMNFGT